MRSPNDLTTSYASKEFRSPNVVDNEAEWRALLQSLASSGARVVASRWRAATEMAQEFRAETPDTYHLVKIVLRTTDTRFSAPGRTVQDGVATAGMFHITESAVSARCVFRGSYDVLHLHLPNDLIAECARDTFGRDHPEHAQQGLKAARAYAQAAAAVPHALHMPSHIFTRLGHWEESAATNERGWKVSEADVRRVGESGIYKDFHNLSYLEYAYIQLGRYRDAQRTVGRQCSDAADGRALFTYSAVSRIA
jgi:hypothetical protein